MTTPISVTLNTSAVVTFNGSGNGTAKIGPSNQRVVWYPSTIAISASTNVNEAACKIYVGWDVSAPNFVGATLSGSTGDSTSDVSGRVVRCNECVFAVWTGGDAGAQGRLVITGTKEMNSGGPPNWTHR